MTCHLGICRRKKGSREEKGRESGRSKKKNSQIETASLFALLAFHTPAPLIVPVLSQFDFSKAATNSLSLFLSHYRDRMFAQPSSCYLPVLGLVHRSANQMGALTFFSEVFSRRLSFQPGLLLITFASTCLVALA